MQLSFEGELTYWRGPSPWHFVEVPPLESERIEATSPATSYGWGCIPVSARIGATRFRTSLFPKDGRYMVPVKTQVRRAESLELGDVVQVDLEVGV